MKPFRFQQTGQKSWLIVLIFFIKCLTTAKSNKKEESDGKQFVPKQPKFAERGGLRELQGGLTNQRLNCKVTGDPQPIVTWETPSTLSENNSMFSISGDYLEFLSVDESVEGNYTCIASNRVGSDLITFQVKVVPGQTQEATSLTAVIVYSILGIVIAVLFVIAVTFIIKYMRVKKKLRDLQKTEVMELHEGSPWAGSGSLNTTRSFRTIINKMDLSIDKESLLGVGEYSKVYKGCFKGHYVAVKIARHAVEPDAFKAMLDEVKMNECLAEHEHWNIVKYFGAEVSNIREREIWTVLEYSPNGCLHKYLQEAQRTAAFSRSRGNDYIYDSRSEAQVQVRIPEETMLYWCEQIACAMHHLEVLKVIHGDVATRNVLLFEDDVVKITDFGLSKRLDENSINQNEIRVGVPWRWVALEYLERRECSHKSDVWSFGITAWEIFTLGREPYNEIVGLNPPHFIQELRNGMRLERPETASAEIYEKLTDCWRLNKDDRPSFEELRQFFRSLRGLEQNPGN